jgi:hypothetical protein
MKLQWIIDVVLKHYIVYYVMFLKTVMLIIKIDLLMEKQCYWEGILSSSTYYYYKNKGRNYTCFFKQLITLVKIHCFLSLKEYGYFIWWSRWWQKKKALLTFTNWILLIGNGENTTFNSLMIVMHALLKSLLIICFVELTRF